MTGHQDTALIFDSALCTQARFTFIVLSNASDASLRITANDIIFQELVFKFSINASQYGGFDGIPNGQALLAGI